MSSKNHVMRCTPSQGVVEIDELTLRAMILDADKHIASLPETGQRAAYYQRVATMCLSSRHPAQALGMLRKALALYCREDVRRKSTRHAHAARLVAQRIDQLRYNLFGQTNDCQTLRDVTTVYEKIYWWRLLDEQPILWDYYCELGKVPKIDYNRWKLIVLQLTGEEVE